MPQTTVEWRQNATETELRSRAAEMRKEWAELSESDRKSDSFRTAKSQFLAEIEDIDVNLSLRQMETGGEQRQAPPGALQGSMGREVRSPGELFAENKEFRAWCESVVGKNNIGASPAVELRALITEAATSGGVLLPTGQPYIAATRQRRLFIRDLITVQTTGLAAIPYVREKNSSTNAASASTVAEGETKPEATVEFTPDTALTQVIATNIPISTQILADANTLVGYVNGRLVYMLKLREEQEILNGNGVTPDLKGILAFSEKQTQAFATDIVTTIGNAIAKIEVVDGYADGIAINPVDAWAMYTKRASTSGVLDVSTPFADVPLNVWGLPTVRTNSLSSGKALVGNFQLGATLFDRQQASVRVFEQHLDYAVKNKVLLLAEERVALAVNRPDWFVDTATA